MAKKETKAKKGKKGEAAASDSVEEQRLALVLKSLEGKFGSGILQTIEGGVPSMPRFETQLPSGSIGLDQALGIYRRAETGHWLSGYAPGRIVEIFGNEGSGKSTMCLQLVANAQAKGIRCAYLDMEHSIDTSYAQALGVQLDKLQFSQPSSGQQCLDIAATLLKSGLFGLIVIDSAAALVPDSELEGETGESTIGAQARLISTSLRQMNGTLGKCLLVFTNQLRSTIGPGSGKTTPGGRALKFYASTRIEIYHLGKLKSGDDVYGQEVGATVVKNKNAPPFKKCKFDLVYGKGIDFVAELFDQAVARKLITANSSWYGFPEDFPVEVFRKQPLGQGRVSCTNILRRPENAALAYFLYDHVMSAGLAERGYYPDGNPMPEMVQQLKDTKPQLTTFVPSPNPIAPLSGDEDDDYDPAKEEDPEPTT